jgi:hypothetical protein
LGTLRSSVTLSHCASDRLAWLAFPVCVAEFRLFGTDPSAALTQIVTGPSGSWEASTEQSHLVVGGARLG